MPQRSIITLATAEARFEKIQGVAVVVHLHIDCTLQKSPLRRFRDRSLKPTYTALQQYEIPPLNHGSTTVMTQLMMEHTLQS